MPDPADHIAGIREFGLPGDLGWAIGANAEVCAAEFGWDVTFEHLVAAILLPFARHHDPNRERGWIATLDERRVGCVFLVDTDDQAPAETGGTAKLRVLLVHPDGRGHRLGTRLVDTCVAFARSAGYERITLWTNANQHAAIAIYRHAGFRLTAEHPHTSWGQQLLGQDYLLDLHATRPPG